MRYSLKKKPQNRVVLNDTMLLLPLDTQQGKKKFCSPMFSLSLSLPTCPNPDINPRPLWPTTIMEGAWEPCPAGSSGRLHKGRLSHPTLSSWLYKGRVAPTPLAPINTPFNRRWERREKTSEVIERGMNKTVLEEETEEEEGRWKKGNIEENNRDEHKGENWWEIEKNTRGEKNKIKRTHRGEWKKNRRKTKAKKKWNR
jgi:hypothetical protein